jgi:hypothetical protein
LNHFRALFSKILECRTDKYLIAFFHGSTYSLLAAAFKSLNNL